MHRTASTLAAAIAAAGLLTACGESTSSNESHSESADHPAWLLASAPGEPSDIGAIKKTAKAGDEVVLRGVIGGRVDAMSTDSALFVLMDTGVHNACTAEDDHCATPWDYCCAQADEITANNATVQLVDESGAPIAIDLRTKGIKPLDTVVVAGVVGPKPSADVLTVKATSIFKAP